MKKKTWINLTLGVGMGLASLTAFAGLERHLHLLYAFQAETRSLENTQAGRPDMALAELGNAVGELNIARDDNRGFGGHKQIALNAVASAQYNLNQIVTLVAPVLANYQQAQAQLQQAQLAFQQAQSQLDQANAQAQPFYQAAVGQLQISERETANSAHYADGEALQ